MAGSCHTTWPCQGVPQGPLVLPLVLIIPHVLIHVRADSSLLIPVQSKTGAVRGWSAARIMQLNEGCSKHTFHIFDVVLDPQYILKNGREAEA